MDSQLLPMYKRVAYLPNPRGDQQTYQVYT